MGQGRRVRKERDDVQYSRLIKRIMFVAQGSYTARYGENQPLYTSSHSFNFSSFPETRHKSPRNTPFPPSFYFGFLVAQAENS